MKKILIIEDDILIAELERDYLTMADCDVRIETNGRNGLELALDEKWDLILLDVMMPEMNGFEVCKRIREKNTVPIILVTARQEDADIIKGMGLGADDYITKPFSPAQLTARVKAHIKMHEHLLDEANGKKPDGIIVSGDLRIDTAARRVYCGERQIGLKNKEYELLVFIASNPNIVHTKEKLYERIWGFDAAGDTATVTVHINRLREKIEQDPSSPEHIITEWGVGYKFVK